MVRMRFGLVGILLLSLLGIPQLATANVETRSSTSNGVTQYLKLTWNQKSSDTCLRQPSATAYQMVSIVIWYGRSRTDRIVDGTPSTDRPRWIAEAAGEDCATARGDIWSDNGWVSALNWSGGETPRTQWNLDDGGAFPYVMKVQHPTFDQQWVAVCGRVLDKNTGAFLTQLRTQFLFYGTALSCSAMRSL
jgi:hypothetical protein